MFLSSSLLYSNNLTNIVNFCATKGRTTFLLDFSLVLVYGLFDHRGPGVRGVNVPTEEMGLEHHFEPELDKKKT